MPLPIILGAFAATLTAAVLSTVFHVGVELDGEEIIARAVKDLRATETLGELAAKFGHTIDDLATDSGKVTDAVDRNLSILTADIHDLVFYLKLLLLAATAYILLRGVLAALTAFREQRETTPRVYIMYPNGRTLALEQVRSLPDTSCT